MVPRVNGMYSSNSYVLRCAVIRARAALRGYITDKANRIPTNLLHFIERETEKKISNYLLWYLFMYSFMSPLLLLFRCYDVCGTVMCWLLLCCCWLFFFFFFVVVFLLVSSFYVYFPFFPLNCFSSFNCHFSMYFAFTSFWIRADCHILP